MLTALSAFRKEAVGASAEEIEISGNLFNVLWWRRRRKTVLNVEVLLNFLSKIQFVVTSWRWVSRQLKSWYSLLFFTLALMYLGDTARKQLRQFDGIQLLLILVSRFFLKKAYENIVTQTHKLISISILLFSVDLLMRSIPLAARNSNVVQRRVQVTLWFSTEIELAILQRNCFLRLIFLTIHWFLCS